MQNNAFNTVQGLLRRLEQLNAIGASLSGERDITRLLEQILLAAKTITHADGGTLYRMLEDGQTLRFEILRTDSLQIVMGGTSGQPMDFPDVKLVTEAGQPNDHLVAAYAAIHGVTVNVEDVYSQTDAFDFSGTHVFDARIGYRSKSFLTVPMRDHDGKTIGVLQLINAQAPDSHAVQAFSDADQRLVESLASQAAIALSNRMLVTQLEALFESFIGLINLAIDEKSPYTGKHCQRVPVLTMMLAEAVDRTTTGPLADFHLSDKDRYELKIAGLLHDCGKVTTPVHVVDKATKLHTLYDRMGVIDTRFEVLKRDEEIAALRQQLDLRAPLDVHAETDLMARCRARQAAVDDDRDFLHRANMGSEGMSDADVARVNAIGTSNQWRNPDSVQANFLSADEMENLCIHKGTLTAAEREIVNHHIVATIKMLEKLPWPQHLKNVPEFAAGHHERMDGRGYPKGLTRQQMSVQARIMGIADIFEALTARDRPYKSGMKLSQAMRILKEFRDDGHIDPDLHDVFVQQQVYRRYGEQFLNAEQLDEVPC
ncbi:HD family phosphohydrolase [Rhodoferax antarcticus]|uniref:Putative metal-dependent phosphohydrolase n=1 Tax=Rhodoferax antarcticus ANT.BR TaxID=1111071 RepID=A0A1Q8YHT7_9BURK|nr:HD family phosphohydrolase [Rhodoferax antarcticus]APW47864.1 phosphohydrolase [Rhodoferax antarcticus]MCW2312291.1 HD-GYP domain-containing protein (c-di-GMP phosphodiesterase class II) [Rhodoferax antarcticus]OLP07631.1 putative metal-dependent phosphohydrolase [Rhodoferax antarcticus ANT.BR]